MSKTLEVEVVLSHSERLPIVDVWMVVDILRASTVMVRWFASGGGDLYPTDSVAGALQLAEALRQEGQMPALMGEQNAIAPEGFDLGNSPAEIVGEVTRKYSCAVMATTNGTKALLKAASMGMPVLVACARNAFAALDLALSKGRRVGIFCSGRKGRPAWDDTLCAGLLISRLKEQFPDIRLADSARLAHLTYQTSKNFEASLRTANHAVFLDKIGFGDDIAFAAEIDADHSVPELIEIAGEGTGRAVLREGRADGVPLLLRKLPENLVHAAEPEPALSFDPFAENAENTEIDETGPGADTPKPLDHVFLAGVGHRKRRGRGERERRA